MSREILFRGKRMDNGEWIEGSLVCYQKIVYIIVHDYQYYISHEELPCFKVILETVGQFTGLLDMNGTKIFEGDIIKVGYKIGEIYWNDDDVKFEIIIDHYPYDIDKIYAKNFEVIGNIHDNSELLE